MLNHKLLFLPSVIDSISQILIYLLDANPKTLLTLRTNKGQPINFYNDYCLCSKEYGVITLNN